MGWIAAGLLVVAVSLAIFAPPKSNQLQQLQAATLRVGLVLGSIWLAAPVLNRLTPRWIAVVGCLVLAVSFRRAIPLAALGLVAVLLSPRSFWEALRPRDGGDPAGPSR